MKSMIKPIVVAVTAGVLLAGCGVGKFSALSKTHGFAMGVSDNKFVKEAAFLGLAAILPVYALAYLADAIVLNSIEFWTGTNPLADAGKQQKVKGADGSEALMTLRADGGIDVEASSAAGEKVSFTMYRDGADVAVVDAQGMPLSVLPM